MAAYCSLCPTLMVTLTGVTEIDSNVGGGGTGMTFNGVLPLTPPRLALIVVPPMVAPVARPPAAMVAADDALDDHVTVEVMFCAEPSL